MLDLGLRTNRVAWDSTGWLHLSRPFLLSIGKVQTESLAVCVCCIA